MTSSSQSTTPVCRRPDPLGVAILLAVALFVFFWLPLVWLIITLL